MSKVRNKPTKYVNHDGWPELKKRLEKEITTYESFSSEPDERNTAKGAFSLIAALENTKPEFRAFYCQCIYAILFQHYPVIKLKVSEAVFESWLITHSVDELKQLINFKENE
jgi:hypothetical protein